MDISALYKVSSSSSSKPRKPASITDSVEFLVGLILVEFLLGLMLMEFLVGLG